MSDMEQIARRAVACNGWRWMRGMLCLTDEDGYASRILSVGLSGRTSETADAYVDGGIICRSYIKDDALPDLADPATLGCLLALVRRVVGDDGLSCFGDHIEERYRDRGEKERQRTRWWVEPSKMRRVNKWVMDVSKNDPCWSEAEALVRVLEAAGTKGLHLTPSADLSVRKPKPLEDSTLRKSFNSREG